ncbi:alkaline phosphatase [Luteimonas sp. S4-F44]|uniref:alkaline phosphatase n=1 Tax=Luteimonas sp. S4-F44 TaxID=2925842 RepID=UPI001F5387B3|nr:alkaline phosphatase [Luteimonas sp. S4-F44]UNK43494.1 alkaline phosphatase [Luteimonas sp. S4-F44]
MRVSSAGLACTLTLLCAACASIDTPAPPQAGTALHVDVPVAARPADETAQWWYRSGAARAAGNGAMAGNAKNVIVFLGDGMSLTTVAAARILEGQRNGGTGEEHQLSWEHFPHTGLSKTYNTDSQTPDSAGTMTAVATGVKSHMGAIGVSAGDRTDCADSQGRHLQSWLRLAAEAGLATGIVTTARLTHATPAATYAHVPDRNWESDVDMPEAARAAGCRDIASQFVDAVRDGYGPRVALGGGARPFLPDAEVMPGIRGQRRDGRNLVDEWQAARPDGAFVWTTRQLQAARASSSVLGLFGLSHMDYEHDRDTGPDGQPDLETMTRFAIDALSRDGKGYVLLVEGGRIDHANHAGNAFRALDETVSMSRAVQAAVEATSADDTLILVTADHSHTLNFVGYPARGNPILGKVRGRTGEEGDPTAYALDATGLPYTTLSYANGPGYTGASDQQPAGPKTHAHAPRSVEPAQGRPDLRAVDTEHPDYMQEALVPMKSESHGGDDVGIWARGPGSDAVRGTMEQNAIYHIIVQATPALRAQLCANGHCNADGVPVELPTPAPARTP